MAKTTRDDVPQEADVQDGNIRPQIPYRDLREWLAEADKLGEVTRLAGIDKDEGIGLAAKLVMHDEQADCVVFDEIPGHNAGYRVLVNFFGGRRRAMTLGSATEASKTTLSKSYYKHYINDLIPISHVIVDHGPVLENVMEGDAVDLARFPAPRWHAGDGGAYIGTGSYSVTRDPDNGALNIDNDRVMLHDRNTVGCHMPPGTVGRIHRDKSFARGKPMPICVVIGGDPLAFLAACTERPHGPCDYGVVGGMRGEALKCIRGKHTGLPFPADAEIVLEGFVDPEDRREKGPFGEWTGYYDDDARPEPVMRVEAVYHRNDPIILGCPPQHPPDEASRYLAITRSAALLAAIEDAGVPDVAGAWAHEVGGSRLLLAVAIRQRYPGHARQAGHVAAMCRVGAYAGRYVIVTDDDVDVSDLEELTWAMLTRSDPATSIDIIRDAWSTPLDPRIAPWDREIGNMTNSRAIIDACRPFHWRDQYPPVNAPGPEIAGKARERFGYLLDGNDS